MYLHEPEDAVQHKVIVIGPNCGGKSSLLQRWLHHAFNPNTQVTVGSTSYRTSTPAPSWAVQRGAKERRLHDAKKESDSWWTSVKRCGISPTCWLWGAPGAGSHKPPVPHDNNVMIRFVDTAGSDRNGSSSAKKMFYRSASAILIVFDGSSLSSWDTCERTMLPALNDVLQGKGTTSPTSVPLCFLVATKSDVIDQNAWSWAVPPSQDGSKDSAKVDVALDRGSPLEDIFNGDDRSSLSVSVASTPRMIVTPGHRVSETVMRMVATPMNNRSPMMSPKTGASDQHISSIPEDADPECCIDPIALARRYVSAHPGFKFFLTSAKTGDGVSELFKELTGSLYLRGVQSSFSHGHFPPFPVA